MNKLTRPAHLRFAHLVLLALPASACGSDRQEVDIADAAAIPPTDGGIPQAEVDAAPPCVDGQAQPCVCATGGIGSRTCVGGELATTCQDCAAINTASGTLCVPGRYEGTYEIPMYFPTAAGFCGLITLYGGGGRGTWSFTLGATGTAEFVEVVGAESCLVVDTSPQDAGVGDGGVEMDGAVWTNAPEGYDAGQPSGPQKLALTGTVDCATGKFKGEVRGTYSAPSICNLGTAVDQYFMKGPVTATFDLKTRSFVDGTVTIYEPPSLIPLGEPAGGSGTWRAALIPDAGALPSSGEDCLGGVVFQDFDIP
ncbi:MAG: hypothetical protein RL385_222 [Pseudomonadota bacterium]